MLVGWERGAGDLIACCNRPWTGSARGVVPLRESGAAGAWGGETWLGEWTFDASFREVLTNSTDMGLCISGIFVLRRKVGAHSSDIGARPSSPTTVSASSDRRQPRSLHPELQLSYSLCRQDTHGPYCPHYRPHCHPADTRGKGSVSHLTRMRTLRCDLPRSPRRLVRTCVLSMKYFPKPGLIRVLCERQGERQDEREGGRQGGRRCRVGVLVLGWGVRCGVNGSGAGYLSLPTLIRVR